MIRKEYHNRRSHEESNNGCGFGFCCSIRIELADKIANAEATAYVVCVVLAAVYAARTVHVRRFGHVVDERLQLVGFVLERRDVAIEQVLIGAIHVVDGVAAPLHLVVNVPRLFEFHSAVQVVTALFARLKQTTNKDN